MTLALSCVVAFFVAIAFTLVLGHRAQRHAIDMLTATLLEMASKSKPQADRNAISVKKLPKPLQRYIGLALPEGCTPIRLAHVRQAGRL